MNDYKTDPREDEDMCHEEPSEQERFDEAYGKLKRERDTLVTQLRHCIDERDRAETERDALRAELVELRTLRKTAVTRSDRKAS